MIPAPSNPRSIDVKDFPEKGNSQEQLKYLLNYAVLAPSAHNAQPWLFRLHDTRVDIIFDNKRTLSIVDPDYREMIISCGAAIGTLALAAKYFGYHLDVTLTPVTFPPNLLANLGLSKSHRPSSDDVGIFAAIKQRHTTRNAFGNTAVSPEVMAQCISATRSYGVEFAHFTGIEYKSFIAELAELADRKQFSQPWFRSELASWMRPKNRLSRDGMSAVRFGLPDMLTPLMGFVVRTFNIGKRVAKRNRQKIQSGSPALAIFASESDSQHDWLNTGRALGHVLLILTRHGLGAAYINQVIEITALRNRLQKRSTTMAYPQILLRIGPATPQPTVSMRRSVSECLIK